MRVTVAEVAARAGVSVASVSRVLNGLPASAEMAARVTAAARELGYVPDASARSLKVRRTEQLTLSVADVGNPVYVAMMRAVERVVKGAGYRLVLSSTGSDPAEEEALVRSLGHGYADGLIISPLRITGSLIEALTHCPVPVVVIGTLPAGVPLDNVRVNSSRGVGLAVDHLVGGGRRAVAFVNGPADTVPGAARQRGFDRAVRAHGLADAAPRVTADDFTYAAGEAVVDRLLATGRPDAVVCANDLIAVGVVNGLRARGRRVPEEIAVTGMDDTDLALMCRPQLTSVRLGAADRGRIAAELLLDRIAAPGSDPRRVTVTPRLVVRESTGPAGRAAGATAGGAATVEPRSQEESS